jgi:hypothetical protein
MHEHNRIGDLDPDIASLGRVKLATWKQVVSAIAWMCALSATSTATAVAVTKKLDKTEYEIQRKADIDVIAGKIDALAHELHDVKEFQARQAAAQEQVAAIAAAIKAGREKP